MTALSIACFGDSLTYGYPYGPAASWVKEAGEKLGIAAVNEGMCGQTSADILARLYRALSCEKADIYVFCGGTNDILRDLAPDEITGNVRAARKAVGAAENSLSRHRRCRLHRTASPAAGRVPLQRHGMIRRYVHIGRNWPLLPE